MADNYTVNPVTSGGATFAADDIGSVYYPRIKITHGADGASTDVSTASPLPVGGPAAHDAAVSGSPILNGGESRTTLPAAVADGDTVRLQADDCGRIVTCPHSPRDLVVQNAITLTDTTETTLIAAAASTFHDLTAITVSNTSATLVRADIRDTTGGTVRMSLALTASGGTVSVPITVPINQAAVNTNWTVQLSGSVTDVRVFAQAVKRN